MPTETKIANPTAQHTPPTRCHHDEPEDQCEPCTLTAERDRLREQNAALIVALEACRAWIASEPVSTAMGSAHGRLLERVSTVIAAAKAGA